MKLLRASEHGKYLAMDSTPVTDHTPDNIDGPEKEGKLKKISKMTAATQQWFGKKIKNVTTWWKSETNANSHRGYAFNSTALDDDYDPNDQTTTDSTEFDNGDIDDDSEDEANDEEEAVDASSDLEYMELSELKFSLSEVLEMIDQHLNDDEQNLLNDLWVQCDTAGSGFMDVLNWLNDIDIEKEDIKDQNSDINVAISWVIDVAQALRNSDIGLPITSIKGFPYSRYVPTLAQGDIDEVIQAIIELRTQENTSTNLSEDTPNPQEKYSLEEVMDFLRENNKNKTKEPANILANHNSENTESTDHENNNLPEREKNAESDDEDNNNIKYFDGIAKGITTSIEGSIDRIADIDDKEEFFITFGVEFARRLRESFDMEGISDEVLNIILSSIVKTTGVIKDGLTSNNTTMSKKALEVTINKVKALDGHMARAGALSMALYADVLSDVVDAHLSETSTNKSSTAANSKASNDTPQKVSSISTDYDDEHYQLDLELVDRVENERGNRTIRDIKSLKKAKQRIENYREVLDQRSIEQKLAEDKRLYEEYAGFIKPLEEKDQLALENEERRERIQRERVALSEKGQAKRNAIQDKYDEDLAKIEDQNKRERLIANKRLARKQEVAKQRRDKIRDKQSLVDLANMIKDLDKEIEDKKGKHRKGVKNKKSGHK